MSDAKPARDAAPDDDVVHDRDFEARRERADHLKERIYLSFASLAVLVALNAHGYSNALDALLTLLVTVIGTLLAVFVADVISFTVAHERAMNRRERQHAVFASFGTLGAVTLPFVFLALAVFGVLETSTALRAGIIALVATLVVIGWAAVRKVPLTWWQRIIALGAEAALALGVVGLQVLAKSG
ncbi:hypothetical protein [Microbacterium sp. BK668]|uniref:hypothetical protein n=1 Tax=Microbacterium sp. BK668 TaxID=2512118 RepID=UPI0010EE8422|nr:hypothetical protein [Microbacterium sp. BK668]TDN91724.1 hypothetical protein EV279_1227 [Microbacterium sp. BK668]